MTLPKDISKVSFDSPAMKQFQAHADNYAKMIRGSGLGSMIPFKSTEDRNEFLNSLAARAVLNGVPAPMDLGMDLGQNAPAPAVGAPPAQAPQPAEGPFDARQARADQATSAVSAARAGGATPGAALQAGQAVDPTGGSRLGAAAPNYAANPHRFGL